MVELNPEHRAVSEEWTERIRLKVAGALGTPALWLAEQVGKRISYDNEYPDEDYDD